MLWTWWGGMIFSGLLGGAIAAWASPGWRLAIRTLAPPLLLIAPRLLWPDLYPIKNTPLYVFIDLVLIALSAALADYAVGLKLGRNDRAGYRHDSLGH